MCCSSKVILVFDDCSKFWNFVRACSACFYIILLFYYTYLWVYCNFVFVDRSCSSLFYIYLLSIYLSISNALIFTFLISIKVLLSSYYLLFSLLSLSFFYLFLLSSTSRLKTPTSYCNYFSFNAYSSYIFFCFCIDISLTCCISSLSNCIYSFIYSHSCLY